MLTIFSYRGRGGYRGIYRGGFRPNYNRQPQRREPQQQQTSHQQGNRSEHAQKQQTAQTSAALTEPSKQISDSVNAPQPKEVEFNEVIFKSVWQGLF